MDLRGHGRSSAPVAHYAVENFVSDLKTLFEKLALSRATVVGWSMGALLTLASCPMLRDRLASLVLVSGTSRFVECDGYPHGLPSTEPRGLSLRLKRNPKQAMDTFYRTLFTPDELAGSAFKRIEAEVAPLLRRPSQAAAIQSLETLMTADLRNLLACIRMPVLLVHGDRDTICPPDASRYMAETLPNATLAILEGAGHAPMLTRPADFNGIVGNFLEGVYGTD